ncbi:MAG: hypothetical protein Q7J68_02055 [Thermoplasmata archaeon]|nr:hypothetical protein [Thermoplasmata archaeon]
MPDHIIVHKVCYDAEHKKQQEQSHKNEDIPQSKELINYYNKALSSQDKGRENQAKFYIKKALGEKSKDQHLLMKLKDLILEIEYDDFEEDATVCFDWLVKLNPHNQELWVEYIDFLIDYVGDITETIDAALIQCPKSEQLLEMKCNVFIEEEENGIEILRTLKRLKDVNPSNNSIQKFKEVAIEILMENEEDDDPEVWELIESI